ncbi:MAG: hypothetical protein OMM_12000 [Candidatus Magnetoglobus multicellularis str. Araruama]|uniref:Uncharacterized protein n=1 Tax=Candidatus Magnetoglobus multicellularis str. Araruama TaxID=890399 RepID=A0A1V1NWX9_9BACT|nr:MAG: hypothetical protein OMM_12000 [Candidatus Magnetoglobus multicellularis str. Araruama]
MNTNVQSHFSISGPEKFTGTASSRTIENALPGTYTITYDPLTCWQTPANESQSLTLLGNTEFFWHLWSNTSRTDPEFKG